MERADGLGCVGGLRLWGAPLSDTTRARLSALSGGLEGPVKLKLPAFGCGTLALLVAVQATVLQLRGLLGHDEHAIPAARRLFIWAVEAVPSTGVGVVLLGIGLWLHRRDRAVERARAWIQAEDRFTVARLAEAHGWTLSRADAELQRWLQSPVHPDIVFHRATGEWLHRERVDQPGSRTVRS